jgi:hypothetical protein
MGADWRNSQITYLVHFDDGGRGCATGGSRSPSVSSSPTAAGLPRRARGAAAQPERIRARLGDADLDDHGARLSPVNEAPPCGMASELVLTPRHENKAAFRPSLLRDAARDDARDVRARRVAGSNPAPGYPENTLEQGFSLRGRRLVAGVRGVPRIFELSLAGSFRIFP